MKKIILMRKCWKCGTEIVCSLINPTNADIKTGIGKIGEQIEYSRTSCSDETCNHNFDKIEIIG